MTKTTTISHSNYEEQGNAVLVLPDELPEKTRKGILIPRTAKEKPQSGLVIDCGPRCEEVKKGDRIQYSRKSASAIHIEGKLHYYTTEDKIFYIYDRNENGE